jgi:hypothetical protein
MRRPVEAGGWRVADVLIPGLQARDLGLGKQANWQSTRTGESYRIAVDKRAIVIVWLS